MRIKYYPKPNEMSLHEWGHFLPHIFIDFLSYLSKEGRSDVTQEVFEEFAEYIREREPMAASYILAHVLIELVYGYKSEMNDSKTNELRNISGQMMGQVVGGIECTIDNSEEFQHRLIELGEAQKILDLFNNDE